MELIVNENSYIDLAEARELANMIIREDDKLDWFLNLSDEKLTRLILVTTDTVNQPYFLSCYNKKKNNYGFIVDCPLDIKKAIILLVVEENYILDDEEYKEYKKLQDANVSSYEVDDASIKFSDKKQGRKPYLESDIFNNYIKKYTILV